MHGHERTSPNPIAAVVIMLLTAGALLLGSCSTTPPGTSAVDLVGGGSETRLTPEWIQDGLIYELFVRDFTPEGTFRAIIPRLGEIQALGIETIWLMPIHPIGKVERKGTLGSPYSVRDYYDVHPDYGTVEDFAALVRSVHERDMHIIIDLVANHTAWDHPWVTEHPEWYTRNAEGNMVPPVPDWSDVADLDFENAALREELTKVMEYWVAEFDIDGYRVDTASMVPADFWKESISRVQSIKPVLFLGETGDPALSAAGFELLYAWSDYGKLKKTHSGRPANVFVASVERGMRAMEDAAYLRFITNHDETAWDSSPIGLFGDLAGSEATAVASMYMPGVPLIYNGQEIGNADSWAFFEKWDYNWDQNPETRDFYERLGAIWQNSDSLRFGDILQVTHDNTRNVVSYLRRSEDETTLVLVNIRDDAQLVRLPAAYHGTHTELFTNSEVRIDEELELEAFGYLVVEL